jgi:hypothetical protein
MLARWRRSSARLSYHASLRDTFGHRIERIHAASQSDNPDVLDDLLAAFAAEPDPAVRKLLALSALRVSKATSVQIPSKVRKAINVAVGWKLPR